MWYSGLSPPRSFPSRIHLVLSEAMLLKLLCGQQSPGALEHAQVIQTYNIRHTDLGRDFMIYVFLLHYEK